jgi:DMSO/TMAO reductase YedYZ molybdopterin-dependent catalytic subunit
MPEAPAQPENRAAPLEALALPETPIELHYRRNHFPYPSLDRERWTLEVTGAVDWPLVLSLDELRGLPELTRTVLLECAGHRRTEIEPPVGGVPWKLGALSQARWSGISLRHVLELAGAGRGAVEVVLYGADSGPFAGVEGTHAYARSLPLDKALDDDTLLAWAMNDEPLPEEHGAPLRAVVPGWYAMDSVKWLTRIDVVTEPFRGPFQELDYRFLEEGDPLPGRRLTTIPIHSLIVTPVDGGPVGAGPAPVRGIAWGGSGGAASVDVRLDDGEWRPARLLPASGAFGHATWEAEYEAPAREHQLSVRATDRAGSSQPERPVWNRRGYANNSIHRVRVRPA